MPKPIYIRNPFEFGGQYEIGDRIFVTCFVLAGQGGRLARDVPPVLAECRMSRRPDRDTREASLPRRTARPSALVPIDPATGARDYGAAIKPEGLYACTTEEQARAVYEEMLASALEWNARYLASETDPARQDKALQLRRLILERLDRDPSEAPDPPMPGQAKPRDRRRGTDPKAEAWDIPGPRPGQEDLDPDDTAGLEESLIRRFVLERSSPTRRNGKPTPDELAALAKTWRYALTARYMAALAAVPGTPSGEALMAMDRIDMSGLEQADEPGDGAYPDDGIYRYLPCYQTGLLVPPPWVAEDLAISFEVLKLDPEAQAASIRLDSHINAGGRWHPGRACILDLKRKALPDGSYGIDACAHGRRLTYLGLLSAVPPRDLGWTRLECAFWETVTLQREADLDARDSASARYLTSAIGDVYLKCIAIANYYLSSARPAVERPAGDPDRNPDKAPPDPGQGSGHGPDKNRTGSGQAPDKAPPGKAVRRIGTLRFVSERAPRPASPKTVRNYVTPSWTVRGHVRTLKSGKTVYIRPRVSTRKSLAGQAGPVRPPQSIVKLEHDDPPPADG